METNEKIFRYTHIFKNVAILYFLFLILLINARISPSPDTIKIVLVVVTLGIGILLLALYRTNSISISDFKISKRTLLGSKSLAWSEITEVSSKGLLLKLHNNDITLAVNSRLYGVTEIFDMIFSKRADLFDAHKNSPFLRSSKNNVGTLAVGLLLVILALLLYFIKDYVFTAGYLGLFLSLQGLLGWYSSPRRIHLENNSLVVQYINKSISISADDIESVQIRKTQQGQFKSVFLVFRDKKHMEISGYKQTPLFIYPVLKQWHEKYAKDQPVTST